MKKASWKSTEPAVHGTAPCAPLSFEIRQDLHQAIVPVRQSNAEISLHSRGVEQ